MAVILVDWARHRAYKRCLRDPPERYLPVSKFDTHLASERTELQTLRWLLLSITSCVRVLLSMKRKPLTIYIVSTAIATLVVLIGIAYTGLHGHSELLSLRQCIIIPITQSLYCCIRGIDVSAPVPPAGVIYSNDAMTDKGHQSCKSRTIPRFLGLPGHNTAIDMAFKGSVLSGIRHHCSQTQSR